MMLDTMQEYWWYVLLLGAVGSFCTHVLPMIIYRYLILKKPVEPKKAKKITIWDAVIVFIINLIITSVTGGTMGAVVAYFFWATIVYNILKSGYEEEQPQPESEDGLEREESIPFEPQYSYYNYGQIESTEPNDSTEQPSCSTKEDQRGKTNTKVIVGVCVLTVIVGIIVFARIDRQKNADNNSSSEFVVLIDYAITFDNNGGSGGDSFAFVKYGAPMPEVAAPTRQGYVFDGYYDGFGKKYYNADMSSARNWDLQTNGKLIAKWIKIDTTTSAVEKTVSQDEQEYRENMRSQIPVYVDFLSITPSIKIHPVGSDEIILLCRCKTVDGSTVWVHIKTDDYIAYIDPSYGNQGSGANEKSFPYVRRIHGVTIESDSVQKGLSSRMPAIIVECIWIK